MSALRDSFSENEDDPAAVESSGSEWDEASEKKRNKRRTSQRLSKKPRVMLTQSSDSDEEEEDEEEEEEEDRKPKPKNGMNRKPKAVPIVKTLLATKTLPTHESANYTPGTFVIAKKDAQSGDMSNPPCIWKIDGKALLQKYEPFKQDDQVRHRNTSIYTGWSALDKDMYAPIKVKVCFHSGQKMEVEINWADLKTINIDSD